MMLRPSDQRREILRKRDCAFVYILNNLIPIDRYYAIADTLKEKFEEANNKNDLDNAYVLGKRFYNFCGEVLPEHDYYLSSQEELKKLRSKNLLDLSDVADKLELIVELMDLQEVERQENVTRIKLEKLEEAKRQNLAKAKEERDSLLQRHKNIVSNGDSRDSTLLGEASVKVEDVSESAQQKLQFLALRPKGQKKEISNNDVQNSVSSLSHHVDDKVQTIKKSINHDRYASDTNQNPVIPTTDSLIHSAPTNITTEVPAVTPPLYDDVSDELISVSPPAYQDIQGTNSAHVLSPLTSNIDEPSSIFDKRKDKPSAEDNLVPINELAGIYRQEFDALQKSKEVEIFTLATYQGRISVQGKDSTNGCAVISPLVAITYLNSGSPGMADSTIESVIDNKAPPILSAVRSKLGLSGSALIIPSDVHDYLVDAKVLDQKMFVGVCGGNLLDPEHVGVLLNMLKSGKEAEVQSPEKCEKNITDDETKNDLVSNGICSKKVAAAIFFHEHVVSLLKLNNVRGESWYDLIDSLPASQSDGKTTSGIRSLGATRTRCKNIGSLEATLRWYACSKFTNNDHRYIDANTWQDELCDFDPRVFQAFVWIEPERS